MGLHKTGITNSTRGVSPTNPSFDFQSQINNLKSQIVAARVTDIVLDENHPKFGDVGQWNGIGAIFYEFVNQSATLTSINFALPYDSQIKTYPLVNEIVLLFSLPNQQIGQNTSNQSYFYLKPLGIWNHPHHDAYPNPISLKSFQVNDYKSTENGVVRQVTDQSTEIELNSPINPSQNTFVEKTNIHPLMPYMGDILMEGRYGQSLRFGSTAKSKSNILNPWSTLGNNGDPITILRNGQPINVDDRGWIPIFEDINQDLSSLYLTSNQKIPIGLSREEFTLDKWITPPISPSEFTSPQILLNSDRIVINSKKDSILFSAQKSVGISCFEEINLTGKNVVVNGLSVYLGSKDKTQPVLKGDDTVSLLKDVLEALKNLTLALEPLQNFPGGNPVPNIPVQLAASTAKNVLDSSIKRLDSLKSNIVKTQ